jgi:GT2 family glycosyltransferase
MADGAAHRLTSVIVCCYTEDRWDDLSAGVAETWRQSGGEAEIIVCVDHNERLLRRARAELPQAVVIENQGEPGLSGARNTGVAAASGDIVVFLDDDAVPAPGWLDALLQAFDDDEHVLAVGGAARPTRPEARPTWFPLEFDWVVGCSYLGLPTRRASVRNVMGCNMAFRRDVFAQGLRFESAVGRTATNVEGCEETELCIRLRSSFAGADIVFEPGAVVGHRVPPQRCSWRYYLRRCYAEGRSKARVSALVGSQDALSSEWTYTREVLPRGFRRGLRDAVGGELAGLGRSAAILLGLTTTSAGYARGRFAR